MTLASGVGHEQRGRRPVVVISDAALTALTMALVVPLSTTDRGWPSHVPTRVGGTLSFALCEQIRSVSVDRLREPAGSVDYETVREIRAMVHTLVGH
jgi:mRNA interferase MazF